MLDHLHSILKAGVRLAFALAPAATLAQEPVSSSEIKNILLVHGAFADGTSWSRVIRILEAKGYHVVAV